ncbi:phosphoribosylaminoimidazolesuccinocarboxamide synthase [Heliophilum fasciatum]|uniref:Phosphoribosylaminoimidazole-succinocarboxamide synthase n=1 Tax=Heliophilum fasciatum TaxID=35700 RepID=A0A4R2RU56_9FIRM|nr:phosphoribosylaminoimidazolesuccinocarboxamide synthase [Heliophilum fasciatum]MCW2278633.1 phosphoribosylaminoimidazole-succinocarboxamide synthase [Heliophilum fasciatum]TCP62665.1 phosphoribosylaminoimidazole-succinocarboxamide synthase [Heliophilum fasciatum]
MASVEKLEQLYEGKAKKIYATSDPNIYWVAYKDSATAFNGVKKAEIDNKGILNNRISALFFQYLEKQGIPTHFVEQLSDREMLVKSLRIIPVEVVARNIVAGSLAKRVGRPEGTVLAKPVLEFYYKDDELGDPLINDYHIAALDLATPEQMDTIASIALRVNDILKTFMADLGIDLVDFKLEFGVHGDTVILGDEISPDTCRFWDSETKEKLDKDRFRRDMGGLEEAYQEILRRLESKLAN